MLVSLFVKNLFSIVHWKRENRKSLWKPKAVTIAIWFSFLCPKNLANYGGKTTEDYSGKEKKKRESFSECYQFFLLMWKRELI